MPTNKQRRQAAQRHLQKQLERRAELARRAPPQPGHPRHRASPSRSWSIAALVITGVFSGDDDTSSDAAGSTSSASHEQRRGRHHERRRHDRLHVQPRRLGQPEPQGRRHPAHARGDPDAGHRDAAHEHQPGRPDAHPRTARRPPAPRRASPTWPRRSSSTAAPATARSTSRPSASCSAATRPAPARAAPATSSPRRSPRGRPTRAAPSRWPTPASRTPPAASSSSCFVDTQLSPDYTPVGTVDEAGLDVLDKVAAAGNDGSFEAQAGGGAPNLPVTINTMTVVG